ncbi:hypothetical protein BC833DRAFT_658132 [Globomyces pollinis-pini]|nr:hypothetical protein BC833DRAFT_658132 [Globomyces pollinis-pini]
MDWFHLLVSRPYPIVFIPDKLDELLVIKIVMKMRLNECHQSFLIIIISTKQNTILWNHRHESKYEHLKHNCKFSTSYISNTSLPDSRHFHGTTSTLNSLRVVFASLAPSVKKLITGGCSVPPVNRRVTSQEREEQYWRLVKNDTPFLVQEELSQILEKVVALENAFVPSCLANTSRAAFRTGPKSHPDTSTSTAQLAIFGTVPTASAMFGGTTTTT